jgi:3-hydroxyisobutyrate dehydrogenase
MERQETVAVIGAGALGAAMALRLGETGYEVRLWNRTAERARTAAASGVRVTPVESLDHAVSGAAFVITVLRDGDAVMTTMESVLTRLDRGVVWVQASTVGPRSALALKALAEHHGVAFLDAPVSGSSTPAARERWSGWWRATNASWTELDRCWMRSPHPYCT